MITINHGYPKQSQIVEALHMPFQSYYTIAATVLNRLDLTTANNPQAAEDLLVTHLIFKCLVKIATWVWPRTKTSGRLGIAKLRPWVKWLIYLHPKPV